MLCIDFVPDRMVYAEREMAAARHIPHYNWAGTLKTGFPPAGRPSDSAGIGATVLKQVVAPKSFAAGIVFTLEQRLFGLDGVLDRRPGHQPVDLQHRAADHARNAAPAARPIARLAAHAVDER